jgi:hypothetical protein
MPISTSSVYVTASCLVPNSAGEITGSRAARSTGIRGRESDQRDGDRSER